MGERQIPTPKDRDDSEDVRPLDVLYHTARGVLDAVISQANGAGFTAGWEQGHKHAYSMAVTMLSTRATDAERQELFAYWAQEYGFDLPIPDLALGAPQGGKE